ncbi:hypothetical protein OTU49_009091 [Cherax quadricarinatus]|uniref:Uncharacterized protein n=1 Tax=Cherax quadricarinatus TaxID=27406 RepID=A0AAW0WN50_CHEQU
MYEKESSKENMFLGICQCIQVSVLSFPLLFSLAHISIIIIISHLQLLSSVIIIITTMAISHQSFLQSLFCQWCADITIQIAPNFNIPTSSSSVPPLPSLRSISYQL